MKLFFDSELNNKWGFPPEVGGKPHLLFADYNVS